VISKKVSLLVFLFFIFFSFVSSFYLVSLETSEKIKVKSIKYLTPDALKESVMRTYLGFKEGDIFSEKYFKLLVELAKIRFRNYNVFNDIKILVNDASDSPNEKVIFIKLIPGFGDTFDAGLWFFKYGKKNFLKRGDSLELFMGVNKNIAEFTHNLPFGWLYFTHRTGWDWKFSVPFFPFYPLYGDRYDYFHNFFSTAEMGFKLHPDIKFGFYAGTLVNFSQNVKKEWTFDFLRAGFPLGVFFTIDQRYLSEKFLVGYKIDLKGGVNIDAQGQNTFPESLLQLKFNFVPNEYVMISDKSILKNQINNRNEKIMIYINDTDYHRGKITNGDLYGNFLIVNNLDIKATFFKFYTGSIYLYFGITGFYDLTILAKDYELVEMTNSLSVNHTLGGGMWVRMGFPVDLTIYANFGYTLDNSWNFSVSLGEFF